MRNIIFDILKKIGHWIGSDPFLDIEKPNQWFYTLLDIGSDPFFENRRYWFGCRFGTKPTKTEPKSPLEGTFKYVYFCCMCYTLHGYF